MQSDKTEQSSFLKEILQALLSQMGFAGVAVEVFTHDKDPQQKIVSLLSDQDLSMLIGRNGQNLSALEHLARAMAFKKDPQQANFSLDINDYRRSKARFIVQNAVEVANRVRSTQKAEALLPMSAYERRLVHVELASCPDVETESIGEEPQRRVVVRPLVL